MFTGTPSRRTESSGGGIVFVAAGCTSTCDIGTMVHCTSSRGKRLQYSVLCEKHCPPGSYPVEYEVKKSMNIAVKRKRLLPHAFPTIHTVGLGPTT